MIGTPVSNKKDHMTTNRALAVALLVSLLLGAAGAPAKGQNSQVPKVRKSSAPDYPAAPKSLTELVGKADLVILGRVISADQDYLSSQIAGRIIVHPIQRLSVRVDDLIKGKALVGDVVRVIQEGGSVVVGDTTYVVDESAGPILRANDQSILLLRWWPIVDSYQIVLGPAGSLRIDGNSVRVPRELTQTDEISRQTSPSVQSIISLLRRHVGKSER